MKTRIAKSLLLPSLIALLSSIPAGSITAQTFTTLHSFSAYPNYTNTDGASPNGFVSSANVLYGTAANGGSSLGGTIFKVNTDGTGFTTLHHFTGGNDGIYPHAGVILSGNTLYGTASQGGSSGFGTVFAVNTDGSGFTTLHSFTAVDYGSSPNTNSDGFGPTAGLILSGNTLYGTAQYGGSSGLGTVFAVNTDGTDFTNLHNFTGSDGINPAAGLILSGSKLYGTAIGGGALGNGTVFAMNTDGTGFTNLHNFTAGGYDPSSGLTNSDGAYPHAGLILSGNTLFGTAARGGSSGSGTLFAVHTDGTGFTNVHNFSGGNEGSVPYAGLAFTNDTLYGTTAAGGSSASGTLFAVHTDGTDFTNLHSFSGGSDFLYPHAGLVLSDNTLFGAERYGGSSGNGTAFSIHTDGVGFTILHSFTATSVPSTNSDGAIPYAGLVTNSSGNILYGTSGAGGSSGNGTVFAMNADGSGFTNLHSFNYSDGGSPGAGLILSGNTLYGTALYGGSFGNGTIFALKTDGTGFTNLHDFTYSDGSYPHGGLILSGNILYGTAIQGGVFAVHTDGTGFTNLHSFTGGGDGAMPYGGLVLAGNTMYGTASQGGSAHGGTIFAINTDGTGFTNVHSFTALSDGAIPYAGLILSGSTLFGTANIGGDSGNGTVFAVHTDGTGFTNLHSFAAVPVSYPYTNNDGANPFAGLILSGSTLYGTTEYGGGSGRGTLFAISIDGTDFTTLHSFSASSGSYPVFANSDGANPRSGLILSGNTLYGTASAGGNSGNGTVFSVSFRPQLTITSAATNVILSWPISYAGFSYAGYYLQQTANLASQGGWATLVNTNLPVIVNGQMRVTTPMLGPQWSYRLAQ